VFAWFATDHSLSWPSLWQPIAFVFNYSLLQLQRLLPRPRTQKTHLKRHELLYSWTREAYRIRTLSQFPTVSFAIHNREWSVANHVRSRVLYRLYDSLSHLFVLYRHVCFIVFMTAYRICLCFTVTCALSSLWQPIAFVRRESREIRRESRNTSCRSFFTKEPLIIGLFCEEPCEEPLIVGLSHEIRDGSLSLVICESSDVRESPIISGSPQKSPIISGYFVKNDLSDLREYEKAIGSLSPSQITK